MAKKLKRALGLPLVTLYGLGNILGAGIYVLVGKVAGEAGSGTLLSFLLAMTIAGLTAFSYMELAGRYPASASVSVYLHKAFGKRWLSVGIGFAMIVAGITSASALAKGFAGYLSQIIVLPEALAAIALLIVIGFIAVKGIGESATTAALFTLVEIAGLALIIFVGRNSLVNFSPSQALQIDPLFGFSGIVGGAFLAFYAFIGFEDMVNVAEETKKPQRTMPLAILISLLLSTGLYLLVAYVATSLIAPDDLARSSAPLALVFSRATGQSAIFITLIGISAAINGVIVQIIMGSRILYGLANQGWIDKRYARVNQKTQTPVVATAVIVGCMIAGAILLPLVSLAKLTSLVVLSIFCLVNLALIKIKRHNKTHKGIITVPMVVPVLGASSTLLLVLYELRTFLMQ